MENITKLTKAEEQVMQIFWKLEKALVKDMMTEFPEPKPAYNTVSTIIRILEKKGFVDHKAYGTTYEYYPLISKESYTRVHFGEFMKNYFNNSFAQMASFFARENKLDLKDIEEMIRQAEEESRKWNDKNAEV
jgi:BlaI family transcriptional regulator, penicillinase repressor